MHEFGPMAFQSAANQLIEENFQKYAFAIDVCLTYPCTVAKLVVLWSLCYFLKIIRTRTAIFLYWIWTHRLWGLWCTFMQCGCSHFFVVFLSIVHGLLLCRFIQCDLLPSTYEMWKTDTLRHCFVDYRSGQYKSVASGKKSFECREESFFRYLFIIICSLLKHHVGTFNALHPTKGRRAASYPLHN